MCLSKAAHGWGWGWGQKAPPPPPSLKSVTYHTIMKLGTIIPYLKKNKKKYESRDTPHDFC